MSRYIDFHTHTLFDVDHGIQKEEDTVAMLEAYKKAGIDCVVFTPHIYHPQANCKVQNIRENYRKAQEIASKIGIDVYLGSELYLEAQTEIKTLPIAGKYALFELPVNSKPLKLEDKIESILDFNLEPVIAHVERYNWLSVKSKEFRMFLDYGCRIQVNVSGIENRKALPYLKKDVVDIIASDNHGDFSLPAKLKKALDNYPKVLERMQSLIV